MIRSQVDDGGTLEFIAENDVQMFFFSFRGVYRARPIIFIPLRELSVAWLFQGVVLAISTDFPLNLWLKYAE